MTSPTYILWVPEDWGGWGAFGAGSKTECLNVVTDIGIPVNQVLPEGIQSKDLS